MLIEGCQLCKPAICIFASLIGVSFISLRSLRQNARKNRPRPNSKKYVDVFQRQKSGSRKKYCKFALVAYQIVVDRNAYALVSAQV